MLDLMHHPLQLRYPEWSTRFCADPAQAARNPRSGFFKEHANTGRLIFPAHFPSPTGGTIERDGKDFRFHLRRREPSRRSATLALGIEPMRWRRYGSLQSF